MTEKTIVEEIQINGYIIQSYLNGQPRSVFASTFRRTQSMAMHASIGGNKVKKRDNFVEYRVVPAMIVISKNAKAVSLGNKK